MEGLLPATVHGHQHTAGTAVVAQVLDAVCRIAGADEVSANRLVIFPGPVAKKDIVVVVGACGIPINSVGDIKVVPCTDAAAAECRSKRDTVDARTGETSCKIVFADQGQLVRFHRHRIDIDLSDIEPALIVPVCFNPHPPGDAAADFIVLALEGGIDLARLRVESHCAEVTVDIVYGAYDTAVRRHFEECSCERAVETFLLPVIGNALYMIVFPLHAQGVGIAGCGVQGKTGC